MCRTNVPHARRTTLRVGSIAAFGSLRSGISERASRRRRSCSRASFSISSSCTRTAPKLVSFSDSRQDAAKAALDVESRHHEDVRRDVLVNELRRAQSSLPTPSDADARLAELRKLRRDAEDRDDVDEERRLSVEIDRVRQQKTDASEGTVRIGDILEDPRQPRFLGASDSREPLKPLIRAFVALGIHPVHPAGTRKFRAEADGETRWFDWHQLFERQGNTFDWRDDVQDQKWLNDARTHLVEQMQKLVTEIILSRTYFSFEEAGLGYLCVPRNPFGGDVRAFESACAFVRVFGDAYRLLDSPYDRTPDPWKDENAIGTTNKVIRFATALWGADARKNLRGVLDQLAAAGHRDGLLATASLRVRLASPDDEFWRCGKCARVHLHRGAGLCTRCFAASACRLKRNGDGNRSGQLPLETTNAGWPLPHFACTARNSPVRRKTVPIVSGSSAASFCLVSDRSAMRIGRRSTTRTAMRFSCRTIRSSFRSAKRSICWQ